MLRNFIYECVWSRTLIVHHHLFQRLYLSHTILIITGNSCTSWTSALEKVYGFKNWPLHRNGIILQLIKYNNVVFHLGIIVVFLWKRWLMMWIDFSESEWTSSPQDWILCLFFLNSTEAEYLSYPHGPFEHEVRLLNSLVLVLSHRLEHIPTIGDWFWKIHQTLMFENERRRNPRNTVKSVLFTCDYRVGMDLSCFAEM